VRTPYRRRSARGGILVLGGGLAGSYVAREARRATVVSPTDRIREAMAPETDLIIGRVVELDPDRRVVELETDTGPIVVAYAELVVALDPAGLSQLGLPLDDRGRVHVDGMLRIVGQSHLWAVGGCLAVSNGTGETDPPPPEDGIRQARRLARNLHDYAGGELRP
jgi:NADH dehydrogenase FAD-containing subunit